MIRRLVIALVVALVVTIGQTSAAPPAGPSVTIEIVGFQHDRGAAMIAVFAGKRGFPSDARAAIALAKRPIQNRRVSIVLPGLHARAIAVAVFHDEDGDGSLKRGAFGRPKEGYGFSRDARGRFGPPSFDAAAVPLPRPAPIVIRMSY